MIEPWTTAADRWASRLAQLIDTLRQHDENRWTQVGQDSNELFPFRGWASLSRDATPNEDVAISVDFRRVDGGVEYRADIAHGDGLILAETPAETIELTDDPAALRAAVSKAMDAVDAFVGAHEDLVVKELS